MPELASGTALLSSFFRIFKDSRSPYLLAGVLCVASLVYISQLANASDSFFFIFAPIGGIFVVLCILCFVVKSDQGSYSEPNEKKDIEGQFKFSRTFCLATGILAITYLFAGVIEPSDPDSSWLMVKMGFGQAHFQSPAEKGQLFWFAYDVCMLHIAVFVLYIAVRSIREENVIHISIFQITLFTSTILAGFVVTTASIADQELWLYSCKVSPYIQVGDVKTNFRPFFTCNNEIRSTKLSKLQRDVENAPVPQYTAEAILSPKKLTYWYLFVHLVAFELFWVYWLVRFLSFRFPVGLVEDKHPPSNNGRRKRRS